jgi:hypothetical protein
MKWIMVLLLSAFALQGGASAFAFSVSNGIGNALGDIALTDASVNTVAISDIGYNLAIATADTSSISIAEISGADAIASAKALALGPNYAFTLTHTMTDTIANGVAGAAISASVSAGVAA